MSNPDDEVRSLLYDVFDVPPELLMLCNAFVAPIVDPPNILTLSIEKILALCLLFEIVTKSNIHQIDECNERIF